MDRDDDRLEGDLEAALAGGSLECLPGPGGAGLTEDEPWMVSLRHALSASSTPLSASAAACLLGVSVRTMQRHLRRLSTNFQKELAVVRGKARPPRRRP